MPGPQNLVDLLLRPNASDSQNSLYLIDRQGTEGCLSYPGLVAEALQVARVLASHGLAAESDVILQLRDPRAFLAGFWGCQLLNLVPVAVPPVLDSPVDAARKLSHAVDVLGGASILTTSGDREALASRLDRALSRAIVDVEIESSVGGETDASVVEAAGRLHRGQPGGQSSDDRVALILLTSGSTGRPKLVQQTHRAILSQIAASAPVCGLRTGDVTLNWLPLEHVGGLVMFHLRDTFVGASQVHAPIAQFLSRPAVWFDWLQRFEATVSWAPNFAYAQAAVAAQTEAPGRWDLSRVRLLLNGGEPIVRTQLDAFIAAAARHGLRPDTVHTVWGMSETCSGVTFAPYRSSPERVGAPVKLGPPIPGIGLRVVDEHGQSVADGVTGELEVGGECVTIGYRNDAEATRAAFSTDGWLHTGDLGYLDGGELHLSGRASDVLIVAGVNIASAEVEEAASLVAGVKAGAVAAFAAGRGSGEPDAVVLAMVLDAEADASDRDVVAAVRSAVARRTGVAVDEVLLVDERDMPRTEIGKIQRKLLRARYERGEWVAHGPGSRHAASAPFAGSRPQTLTEQALATFWTELFEHPGILREDDFFALGGKSLDAMALFARIEREWGIALPAVTLFEAPSLLALAERVDAMRSTGVASSPDFESATVGPSTTRASCGQEALGFLDLLQPNDAYIIAAAIRIHGSLDRLALEKALSVLVRRHESLRSYLTRTGDGFQLDAMTDVRLPLEVLDLEAHSRASPGATEIARACSQFAYRPMPMGRPLLMRCGYVALDEDDHVLVLALHHALGDGWSMQILARELGQVYREILAGQDPASVSPGPGYRDYAARQRRLFEFGALAPSREYWSRQLSGAEPLDFARLTGRTTDASSRCARVRFALDRSSFEGLSALGQPIRATPFMVLLTIYQWTLARVSGAVDIAIGTPMSGRTTGALAALVGYVTNMVVVRPRIDRDAPFDQALCAVRDTCIDALAHQEFPFDRLVSLLDLPRPTSATSNPLFQASFAYEEGDVFPLQIDGAHVVPIDIGPANAKFDLALTLRNTSGEIHGELEFRTGIFDRIAAESLVTAFRSIAEQVAAAPKTSLRGVAAMDPETYRRVVVDWNETRRDFPSQLGLADLFQRVVDEHPDNAAVRDGDRVVTYRALAHWSDTIAAWLARRGTCAGEVIGLCAGQGVELVVGMLGILKSGAAYLPLDPDYPDERLQLLIADAGCRVVLAEAAHGRRLADVAPAAAVLELAEAEGDADVAETVRPGCTATGASPAYIIYTSGSTGQPKPVQVPQRAVARLVLNTDYVELRPTDCIAQAATPSFDAATFEIWGALLHGGCISVMRSETLLSGKALARQIADDGITVMFVTTAIFNLHARLGPDVFARLETLLFGGESGDPAAVRRVMQADAPRRLINVYGPTEATTLSTWYLVPRHFAESSNGELPARVPIGKPIANTRCYVLDDNGRPQLPGFVGELYIGGPGVADGYRNRAEETEARFVADTLGDGTHLYRTGDRVVWRDPGVLEFVDRVDRQVKLRGYRIEPGETEAALRQQPGVADAAVLVVEPSPGDRRLLGFIVGQDPASIDIGVVQKGLRRSLPVYLRPAEIRAVPALPMTRNGKIDRQALLDAAQADVVRPAATDGHGNKDGGREGNETTQVRRLWCEILGTEGVREDDDFFESGGDSLLAVRLLTGLEGLYGVELSLRELFERPRFGELVDRIIEAHGASAAADGGHRSCIVSFGDGGDAEPLFFMSGYGGALMVYRELANAFGGRRRLHVLDPGVFSPEQIRTEGLAGLARHMLDDIRQIQTQGPYHLLGYSMGGKFVYEIARLLRARGQAVGLLGLIDCHAGGYLPQRTISHRLRGLWHTSREEGLFESLRSVRRYVEMRIKRVQGRQHRLFKQDPSLLRSSDVARRVQDVSDAMLQAWVEATPEPYDGDIKLFVADIRRRAVLELLNEDPYLGWPDFVSGDIERITLHCAHREIFTAERLPELVQALEDVLPKHRV